MYLLDTNILSELPKRRPNPAVVAWFSLQKSIAFSAITLEELRFGVSRMAPGQGKNLARWLEALLSIPPTIIPVDEKIANSAGQLRATRERAGRVSSQADMLIAATALTGGYILVTRNIRDYEG